MSKQPEFFALFCDSVRHEIGGMQSLVGVFQDVVLLEEMPQILPRLSVFFNLHLFDADLDRLIVELQQVDTRESLTAITLNDVEGLRKRLTDMGDRVAEVGVKVNGTIEAAPFKVDSPMALQLCARLSDSRTILSSSRLAFDVARAATEQP